MSFFNGIGSFIFWSPFLGAYVFFVLGWVSAFYFRKQFLVSLLSLELVVLGLFLGVSFCIRMIGHPVSISFYLLVFGACEASLGLRLLVSIVRLAGRDMLSLLRAVKC